MIPNELIDCALQLINFWFYNSETKNAMNTVPDFVNINIDVTEFGIFNGHLHHQQRGFIALNFIHENV